MQFEETQRFRQWWIWLLLLLAAILPFMKGWLRSNFEFIRHIHITGPAIIPMIIIALVIILFAIIKLETKVDETAISYRFYPIQIKMRHKLWEDIDKAYVRKYSPILEYGGWGYRFVGRKRGDALNISGNKGLQIVFKNGNKLLIGTNKPEELNAALKEIYEKGIVKANEPAANVGDRY
ncbi:MAG: hypothetical protein JST82_13015 [Bacteroidetes bacterium]|nr:hypothetical protein [Bacteroidota bacterium]